ncbi:MAG: amidohydrolase family protein, partial [Planctomycetes bacterium]|nr:amidohydrolase family protein [Planctomycetota bacterium]
MDTKRHFHRLLLLVALAQPLQAASDALAQADEAPFAKERPPTLIIVNGRVWTGVPGAPQAEAVAILNDTIIAVGTSAEVRALANSGTRTIDAKSRRVIPGITDSHTHIVGTGLQLQRIDLRTTRDRTAFVNTIAAAVSKLSPGQWLLGGRYTVDSWADPSPPRKEWIDSVTPGVPVFLTRMDGHQALVNSVALKFAGIDRNGPDDPPGGEIVRDRRTGEPTGILKDSAMNLVDTFVPKESNKVRFKALQLAMKTMN